MAQEIYQRYVSGQISRDVYLKEVQEFYTKPARDYYKSSSVVLDYADKTEQTKKLFTTMQEANPKTVEESLQLELATVGATMVDNEVFKVTYNEQILMKRSWVETIRFVGIYRGRISLMRQIG